jgi:hypothetical protein
LVRGVKRSLLKDMNYGGKKFAISMDEDVYLRSLGYSVRAA